MFHGPWVEAGDLVIGPVGGNVGAGGEFLLDDFDAVGGNMVFRQPFEVSMVIVANGGQDYRGFTQQGEGVGNVTGGAAESLYHTIDGEGDVQNVYFLGQDMVREVTGKVHNPVVCQGAGNNNVHKNPKSPKLSLKRAVR